MLRTFVKCVIFRALTSKTLAKLNNMCVHGARDRRGKSRDRTKYLKTTAEV
jgi:hypothetical protein